MLRRRELLKLESLERRACPAAASLVAPLQVAEGGAAKAITVTLDAPSAKVVSVDYLLQGSATPSRDFTLAQGSRTAAQPRGTLTFAPGQTQHVLSLSAIDDTLREGSESLTITLISPKGCTLGAARSATVTVRDNDAYTAALEGPSVVTAGITATYTLRLSSPATRHETFYVSTAPGTAVAGSDFGPLTNLPVTITAGGTSKQFSIQTRANSAGESDEMFSLRAVAPTDGFPAISPLGILIPGGGAVPARPSVSVSDASIVEGNSGTATVVFVVSLSTASANLVTVTFASRDQTATAADQDYGAVSGVISFSPGETRRSVSVPIFGDVRPEADESFELALTAPVNAVLSDGQGVCVIQNDDTPSSDPAGFQIQIDYVGNVRKAIRDACNWAAQRWSQIIIGDLPGYNDPQYGYTDDFRITVQEGLLGGFPNGEGGTLANARPLRYRSDSAGLPWLGETGIDPFDATNAQLRNVVLHELGHALGFGGLWLQKNLVRNLGPGTFESDPIYVGANAVREYNRLYGAAGTSIPAENRTQLPNGGTGPGRPGDGSYAVHWREAVLTNELMTSAVENIGIPMPLSSVTVGAMQDLGYQVNYAAADSFSPVVSAPTWSVSDFSVTEGNNGITTMFFYLSMRLPQNLPSNGSYTVALSFRDGTASAGSDYVRPTTTTVRLTINGTPTSTLQSVRAGVQIYGDTVSEPNETLFVDLLSPTGGSVIGNGSALITILDSLTTATGATTQTAAAAKVPAAWTAPASATLHMAFHDASLSHGGGTDFASRAFQPKARHAGWAEAWRHFNFGSATTQRAALNPEEDPFNRPIARQGAKGPIGPPAR